MEPEAFAALVGIEKQLIRISVALYVLARLRVDEAQREGRVGVNILEAALEEQCWPKEPES